MSGQNPICVGFESKLQETWSLRWSSHGRNTSTTWPAAFPANDWPNVLVSWLLIRIVKQLAAQMLIIRKKLVPTIADTYFSLNGWIACLDNSLESGSPLIRSIPTPRAPSIWTAPSILLSPVAALPTPPISAASEDQVWKQMNSFPISVILSLFNCVTGPCVLQTHSKDVYLGGA